MKLVETHAHLYSEQFKLDRTEALHRAVAAGVDTILLPNIDHRSIDAMLELEADFPQTCHAMMGLHPCSVGPDFEKELQLLEDWLARRPFVAVGECGIDLYWDKTYLPQQQEALRAQLRLAKQYDLPIVLHTRSAFEEAFELVAEAQDGTLRGVFHCFSDGVAEAERIISLGGFKLGIGGVATFKTDCPYLAPVPYRGKRNEPAYLPLVLHRIASLLGQEPEAVAAATTRNAQELFKL
jgi:TatD DNase family protein